MVTLMTMDMVTLMTKDKVTLMIKDMDTLMIMDMDILTIMMIMTTVMVLDTWEEMSRRQMIHLQNITNLPRRTLIFLCPPSLVEELPPTIMRSPLSRIFTIMMLLVMITIIRMMLLRILTYSKLTR